MLKILVELEKQYEMNVKEDALQHGFFDEVGVWCWLEEMYYTYDEDLDFDDDPAVLAAEFETLTLNEEDAPHFGRWDDVFEEWYWTEEDYIESLEYDIDWPDNPAVLAVEMEQLEEYDYYQNQDGFHKDWLYELWMDGFTGFTEKLTTVAV